MDRDDIMKAYFDSYHDRNAKRYQQIVQAKNAITEVLSTEQPLQMSICGIELDLLSHAETLAIIEQALDDCAEFLFDECKPSIGINE